MKISIITPSVRPEMLEIVIKCLGMQTFKDFEWVLIMPQEITPNLSFCYKNGLSFKKTGVVGGNMELLIEPEKRKGDFYSLNKAWNKAFKYATGELIISIVDGIWFSSDTLERFWNHYQENPKACIGGVGNQYEYDFEKKQFGALVWKDPRLRTDYGSFWEIKPIDLELCMTSIPRQAILDCGGVDEIYDQGAAISEKEMCLRIDKLGYRFFLDSSLEYKAIKHPRLHGEKEWNEHYEISCKLLEKHISEINNGTRLKLNYL